MAATGTDRELLAMTMGQYGGDYIDDDTTHTGKWWKIVVCAQATFTSNTLESGAAQSFGGTAQAVGTELVGNFTAIDLVSGEVWAVTYQGN